MGKRNRDEEKQGERRFEVERKEMREQEGPIY